MVYVWWWWVGGHIFYAESKLSRPLSLYLHLPQLCETLLIVFLSAPYSIILFSFLLSQRFYSVLRPPGGVAVRRDPEENMNMPYYGVKTHQKDVCKILTIHICHVKHLYVSKIAVHKIHLVRIV